MVAKSVNEWISTFKSGNPLLLTAIVNNNPNLVSANLETVGQKDQGTPAEIEAVIKEMVKSGALNEETFFQILNVPNNTNGNPDFTEVLATALNLWDGSGNQFQTLYWGQTFPDGIKNLYRNLGGGSNINGVVMQKPGMMLPMETRQPNNKEKMQTKKGAFIVVGMVLVIVLFILVIKKFM